LPTKAKTSRKASEAIAALSALAHEGRLQIFRLLVHAGEAGMAAGEISRTLEILPNTLSANLNILSGARVVQSHRAGRSIIYSIEYKRVQALLAYLMEDCCGGRSEICAPLASIVNRCC